MFKRYVLGLAAGLMCLTGSAFGSFQSYIIRGTPTIQPGVPTGTEFLITSSGDKAALGSDDVSGFSVGQLGQISIDRLDDYTRFTAGSGPAVGPYINIWITDGTHYAVIANEPSNAEWQPGNQQWNMDWATLSTKTAKVYENDNKSWLPNNGVGLTFGDLAGFTMKAPSVAELTTGWTGLGSGAPRELGTNNAYAFNWVFGDTLSNYVSGDPGYRVGSPVLTTAMPVPSAVSAGVLLLALLGARSLMRRRVAA